MQTYEVGQTVWVVPTERYLGKVRECTIVKIGRKWATLDDQNRFDVEDGFLDGRGLRSPGRVWLSKEAFEKYDARRAAWRDLVARLPYECPPSISADDINTIRKIVGLPTAGQP